MLASPPDCGLHTRQLKIQEEMGGESGAGGEGRGEKHTLNFTYEILKKKNPRKEKLPIQDIKKPNH